MAKKSNKLFDSKLFWAVVSLLASILCWLYVTGTQEEIITRRFDDVPVVFVGEESLQESKGLVITEPSHSAVSVEISGTRSNIGKLDRDDLQAVIDVSKITRSGSNTVAYTIKYPDTVDASAVTVTGMNPAVLTFFVESQTSKAVVVRGAFVGNAAEGYIVGEVEISPAQVTVYGPKSLLDRVDHAYATIGGVDISKTKTADVEYVLIDADGQEVAATGLTFEYETVTATVPVSLKKEVPFSITVIAGAGATEDTCRITFEPATITISGDAAIVEAINSIQIADVIDLSGFEASMEDTFTFVLPNGVENVTGITEVKVKVEVLGLQTARFAVTNLNLTNVPEGMTAEILSRSIEVTIRATAEVLEQLKSSNLRAVVDMTGVSATGDVFLPADILVDGFGDCGAIGEYKITVNIKG